MSESVKTYTKVYDNFSGGDWGAYDGKHAPPNSFRAINMLVRQNGRIGPRPGVRNQTPASMPNGVLLGLTPTGVAGQDGMFIIGDRVYTFDLFTPATAPTDIGGFSVVPTEGLFMKEASGDIWYVAVPGDQTYKINPPGFAVDPVTGSPGGYDVEIYGTQLVVASGRQGTSNPNRIYYSDVNAPGTWGFFDLGDNFGLGALNINKNYLSAIKSDGMYIISGVLGSGNDYARLTASGQGVLHPWNATRDQKDKVWYQPKFRTNPAVFNSASADQVSYFTEMSPTRDDNAGIPPLKSGVSSSIGVLTESSILYMQGGGFNTFQLYHNGVWTRHTSVKTLSGMVRGGNTGFFVCTDGGGISAPAKIYSIDFLDARPALASDTINNVGDDSSTPLTTSLQLPEWWSPDGDEVYTFEVTVDFVKFNTGVSAHNHFDLTPTSLGRFPNGIGDKPLSTQSWDEITSSSSASGTNDRKVFKFVQIRGGGVQLAMANIVGVDIKSLVLRASATTLPR